MRTILQLLFLTPSILLFGCQQQSSVFKDISSQYRPKTSIEHEQRTAPVNVTTEKPTALLIDNPYNLFLHKNQLPTELSIDESPEAYSQRLRQAITARTALEFVNPEAYGLVANDPPFVFGVLELKGLMIFLNAPYGEQPDEDELGFAGIGHCSGCHTPPTFSSDAVPDSLRRQQPSDDLVARLNQYRQQSEQARLSKEKNTPIAGIVLNDSNIQALTAFLQALKQKIDLAQQAKP